MSRAIVTLLLATSAVRVEGQRVLPTRYEADRFYFTLVTERGDTLMLFTDTGGGLFLYAEAAERTGLVVLGPEAIRQRFGNGIPAEAIREMGGSLVELPAGPVGRELPALRTPFGDARILPVRPPGAGNPGERAALRDGMLGQGWFAGRVWTFDYPGQRLLVHDTVDRASVADHIEMKLGFRSNAGGSRQTNYPRMQIVVDADTLDMLFDTGATTLLTPEAVQALGDGGPDIRATSFITASTFDRWRTRHADWRMIENAERGSGMAMIEARDVVIAGHTIPRVWFTRRADANFHEWMSQWMDRRIEGAIGGNALRFFRITVDYPNAVAWFLPR